MSSLRDALADYLRVRRRLGFEMPQDGRLLEGFVELGVSEEPCKRGRKDGSCLHLRVIRAIIWVVRARSGASLQGERSDLEPSSGEGCCRGCRAVVGWVSPGR